MALGIAFLVAGLWSMAGLAVLGLWIGLDIFISASLPNLGVEGKILLVLITLAMPASAYLATYWLDRFCHGAVSSGLWPLTVLVLVCALGLSSDYFPAFLEAGLQIVRSGSALSWLGLASSLAGAVFACAATIALVPMLIYLLAELPVQWWLSASRTAQAINWSGLRSVVILFTLGLLANVISGFMLDELWPTTIFKLVAHG